MLGQKRKREESKEIKLNEKQSKKKDKDTDKIKKKQNSSFLIKLYQILETSELVNIIAWEENGNSFKVKNITDFTEKVLPKYFKHNNFASFVRQVFRLYPN